MKKIIVMLVFCLLSLSLFSQTDTKTYKIGDIGPGGGLVFHIDGDEYLECSKVLGQESWKKASRLAKKYINGDYKDWYLPTKEELNYIYVNLVEKGFIEYSGPFWSSSEGNNNDAWGQYFRLGRQNYDDKTSTAGVFVV